MCTVCLVYKIGSEIPQDKWTVPGLVAFHQMIKGATDLDQELEQPDCHDPKKAEWVKELEDYLL